MPCCALFLQIIALLVVPPVHLVVSHPCASVVNSPPKKPPRRAHLLLATGEKVGDATAKGGVQILPGRGGVPRPLPPPRLEVAARVEQEADRRRRRRVRVRRGRTGRRRAGRVRRGDGGQIRLGEIQARARGRFVLRLQEVVGRERAGRLEGPQVRGRVER